MRLLLSVLDLSPISAGSTGVQALRNTLDHAPLADRLGYARYWVAEHHIIARVAGTAPEAMISQVASVTNTMIHGHAERRRSYELLAAELDLPAAAN